MITEKEIRETLKSLKLTPEQTEFITGYIRGLLAREKVVITVSDNPAEIRSRNNFEVLTNYLDSQKEEWEK